MAAHLTIRPDPAGTIAWRSATELVYRHPPFQASTTYTVRLSPGYRDARGNPNQLAHRWRFTTEAPPTVTGSSPGAREQNVDPASYIALQFSRPMDLRSLARATSISPVLPLTLRQDPGDPRRVIVAPLTLLEPDASYSLTVTPDARDVDGNPLDTGVSLDFATGSQRPLRHWVTFIAEQGVTPAGIWVVDESHVPRQVSPATADAFAWSPDGTHLLVRSAEGAWSSIEVGGKASALPFRAEWAGYLASGLGYAYLDHGRLAVMTPSGRTTIVDTGVSEAAVSPDGEQLAYVAGPRGPHGRGGTEIRGYSVELRSHYRIGLETDGVDSLAWSPDASRLAYRVAAAEATQWRIRVRGLLGAGGAVTIGIGEVDAPRWLADSRHVVLSASVAIGTEPRSRPFRLSATDQATRPLTADQAIPTPPGVDVRDPMPSPDGHQLAFLQPTAGGDQVWVMNLDGTGFTALTTPDPSSFPYSCRAPTWTRD